MYPVWLEVDYPQRLAGRAWLTKPFRSYLHLFFWFRVAIAGFALQRRAQRKGGVSRDDALRVIGMMRATLRILAYSQYGLCDAPPPRTTEHVADYPVRVWVELPEGDWRRF